MKNKASYRQFTLVQEKLFQLPPAVRQLRKFTQTISRELEIVQMRQLKQHAWEFSELVIVEIEMCKIGECRDLDPKECVCHTSSGIVSRALLLRLRK